MSVHALETKAAPSVAAMLRVFRSPLKIPAWSVVAIVLLAGIYGFAAGRQNPAHHYVPYVGYPLVLDTTTGKACYSTQPKPSDDPSAVNSALADPNANGSEADSPTGPAIPVCGK